MKFACMIATRGNPKRAAAVMECASSLASGSHDLRWVIGCDVDDPGETRAYFKRHYPDVDVVCEHRPAGVGEVWNRCARIVDADIYVPMPDDSWPGLPNWDFTIAARLNDPAQIGVIAWNDTANPNQCSLPVITREWYRHAGLYDNRFPFWFYDTCVAELWSFVTGRTVEIPQGLLLSAQKGKTRQLRDLTFWWDYYTFTRHERLKKAESIRHALGRDIAPDLLRNVLDTWEYRDNKAREHLPGMEAAMALNDEPWEGYRQAKHAASMAMMLEAA